MLKKLIQKIKDRIRFIIQDLSRILPDKMYLKILYKKCTKNKLDLSNPQTFNEKLQWLKLNNRKDEYTKMVDKYEVKKYVANIIGEQYIIPTIGVYDKFKDIDFDKLPNQFVLKCTHDSGGIVICKNKNNFDKTKARKILNFSLRRNYFYYSREYPYKNVKRRIIAEKYMQDEACKDLRDYKLFCFDGECKLIQVDFDRFKNHRRNLYDLNWNLIEDLSIKYPSDKNVIIEKPSNLDEMLEIARKLSKNIPFVRVDLYLINGKIYFGELTFFHGGGYEKFTPEEWNKKLGDMIKINKK